MVLMLEDYDGRNALAGYDLDIPHTRQAKSGRSDGAGVFKQYHQSVSAKAQTRSPKSEGRRKAETRNPKCPSVASAFGIRPSFGFRPLDFGFGRLAAGGTVQYA
jgi:hypothetical protein